MKKNIFNTVRGPLKTKKSEADKSEKAELPIGNEHFEDAVQRSAHNSAHSKNMYGIGLCADQRRNSKFLEVPVIFFLLMLGISCTSNSGEKNVTAKDEISSSGNLSENDSMEVSGILICTHCYSLNEKNTGIDHQLPENGFVKNCASLCAQQNYPIGVLSEAKQFGSNVWVIRTSSQLFTDYMSKEVRIKGVFIKEALIEPSHIEVKEGAQWIILL